MGKPRSDPDATVVGGPGRYGLLFVGSVLQLVLQPMLDPLGGSGGWGGVVLRAVLLLGALVAVRRHRRLSGVAMVLIVVALASAVTGRLVGHHGATTIGAEIVVFVVLGLIGTIIFVDVMRVPRVTSDTLFGAACIYIVLGLWWARLHLFVEWSAPGSYAPGLDGGVALEAVAQHLTYFSFVTLATLGYGDVVPVSVMARNLAVVEAIMGQLYVAILIGRLVGLAMRDER